MERERSSQGVWKDITNGGNLRDHVQHEKNRKWFPERNIDFLPRFSM